MTGKLLSWAAENGVTFNLEEVNGVIAMVVRKDDLYTAFCVCDIKRKIDPICHNFLNHFLLPAIEAIHLEHVKTENLTP